MEQGNNISIAISKDIVNPIVEAKIRDAVTEALGGKDKIIREIVGRVLEEKVNYEGKVSNYSSDNKYSWLEWHFGELVKDMVKEEVKKVVSEQASAVKDEVMKQMMSKKGASGVAAAMLAGLTKTLESSWSSSIEITFNNKK